MRPKIHEKAITYCVNRLETMRSVLHDGQQMVPRSDVLMVARKLRVAIVEIEADKTAEPLFLAVIHDRHSDDAYGAFTDPQEGKEWVRAQLEALGEYVSWDVEVREGVRGTDFFGNRLAYFLTYDDGPSGWLEPLKIEADHE